MDLDGTFFVYKKIGKQEYVVSIIKINDYKSNKSYGNHLQDFQESEGKL